MDNMDYMVYVDNSNDRFSLLDMIEKDCEALDSDEKWHISHVDKNNSTSDSCWMDSSAVKVVPNVRTNVGDAASGVNRDPHLLVNPRTVAPLLENDAMKAAVSAVSVVDRAADAADISFSEVEPSAKLIKIEPVDSEYEMPPSRSKTVSGTKRLAPASANVSSPVGTMQVFLQVTATVDNLMQTGGNVCFVVEPQTLCTTAVSSNADKDSVSAAASQLVDSDIYVKDEVGTGSETYEKPAFSYSCLIAMALKNSNTGSLPVNEIYAYIL